MNGQNMKPEAPIRLEGATGAWVQKPRRAEWLAAMVMLLARLAA